MSDSDIIKKVASLWIELGGDSEGIAYTWMDIRDEVEKQLKEEQGE